VFDEPLAVHDAIERVERWLGQDLVTFLVPGSRHLSIAFQLLERLGTAANLTTDVQIAAHALEHNAEVFSNDRDFGRFEGLRWTNPLSPDPVSKER
jgi:predicted nucleic acid-binding protein